MTNDSTASESMSTVRERQGWQVVLGSVSGGAYAPNLTTSGSNATGANAPSASRHAMPTTGVVKVSAVARQHCNTMLSACIDDLHRALVDCEEYVLRNNALEQAKERLARLWNIRVQREPQFAEAINMLQLVFADRELDCFDNAQLRALITTFERLRDEPMYDDNFLNEITAELLRSNVDVFRGID